MFEDEPITMPADPSPWIVPDHQGLREFIRSEVGERGGLLAEWQQPIGNWIGWAETSRVEVVSPAVGGGQALPKPSMEAEQRQLLGVDAGDQGPFPAWRDDRVGLRQASKTRLAK